MKKQFSTEALWQQFVKESGPKAFERLFFAFNHRLIKFCIYYVHKREIAEEIVSDMFVKCWQNRTTLQNIANPETYMFVCVKNQALNYNKKMSTIHFVDVDEHTSELIDTSSPELMLQKKELLFKLDRSIEALPLHCKIIFRLVKEDGMKCKEVADILGLSIRTVHTQLFRAMKKLSLTMVEHKVASPSLHQNRFYNFLFISTIFAYLSLAIDVYIDK